MINKNNDAYKSISEVAELLNLINPKTGKVSTHTLRFWEKEFKQIKPKIFAGNRRYYDNKTIEILQKITKDMEIENRVFFHGYVEEEKKKEILKESYGEIDQITNEYSEGSITYGERYNKIIDVWAQTNEKSDFLQWCI